MNNSSKKHHTFVPFVLLQWKKTSKSLCISWIIELRVGFKKVARFRRTLYTPGHPVVTIHCPAEWLSIIHAPSLTSHWPTVLVQFLGWKWWGPASTYKSCVNAAYLRLNLNLGRSDQNHGTQGLRGPANPLTSRVSSESCDFQQNVNQNCSLDRPSTSGAIGKIGIFKNGKSVCSFEDIHCGWVLAFLLLPIHKVANFLPKLLLCDWYPIACLRQVWSCERVKGSAPLLTVSTSAIHEFHHGVYISTRTILTIKKLLESQFSTIQPGWFIQAFPSVLIFTKPWSGLVFLISLTIRKHFRKSLRKLSPAPGKFGILRFCLFDAHGTEQVCPGVEASSNCAGFWKNQFRIEFRG